MESTVSARVFPLCSLFFFYPATPLVHLKRQGGRIIDSQFNRIAANTPGPSDKKCHTPKSLFFIPSSSFLTLFSISSSLLVSAVFPSRGTID